MYHTHRNIFGIYLYGSNSSNNCLSFPFIPMYNSCIYHVISYMFTYLLWMSYPFSPFKSQRFYLWHSTCWRCVLRFAGLFFKIFFLSWLCFCTLTASLMFPMLPGFGLLRMVLSSQLYGPSLARGFSFSRAAYSIPMNVGANLCWALDFFSRINITLCCSSRFIFPVFSFIFVYCCRGPLSSEASIIWLSDDILSRIFICVGDFPVMMCGLHTLYFSIKSWSSCL